MIESLRTGIGYDVHAFAEACTFVLGGVKIPYHLGLDGHSDADVLVHAIMDALLGAAAIGDIGQLFPDSDSLYKDIKSTLLLKRVADLLSTMHYSIINVDAVVMCQKPKIMPYAVAMTSNIASALSISKERVGIKATTTEKLGCIGREEGVAAQAVALIYKPKTAHVRD